MTAHAEYVLCETDACFTKCVLQLEIKLVYTDYDQFCVKCNILYCMFI